MYNNNKKKTLSLLHIFYAINAAALVSIFARQTGHVILIFSEQSSQMHTCPHGKIITYKEKVA